MLNVLGLLVWFFWLFLAVYIFWFFFRAKTVQPLTLDDLALTWRLHKKETGCKASRIHSLIVKNDMVVGFRCDCGYEFIQKRLVTQKTHMHPQNRIKPFASVNSAIPVSTTKNSR